MTQMKKKTHVEKIVLLASKCHNFLQMMAFLSDLLLDKNSNSASVRYAFHIFNKFVAYHNDYLVRSLVW